MAKHQSSGERVHLRIIKGEDYTSEISWITDEDLPMNISGPASMEIRDAADQLIMELDDTGVKDGQLFLSSASGVIQIVILSQVTKSLIIGGYQFDLFCVINVDSNLIDTGKQVRRVLAGTASVSDNITKNLPTP